MAKSRRSQRGAVRRVARPRRSLFGDESGFTGPDLLARAQPFVAYAAVEIEERRANEIISASRAKYNTQAPELKASTLLRRERGRQQVLEILREVSASRMRIIVHNKRYALAAKFVEYILEPALRPVWRVLWHYGFHRFVAKVLYEAMEAQDADAEELVVRFLDFMRGRDDAALWTLLDTQTPHHPFLQDLGTIARAYRTEILTERANAHAVQDVPAFVMDLTATSVLSLLMSMPHRLDYQYRIILDDSHAMRAAAELVDPWVPEAMLPPGAIDFGSSEQYAGIQIADLAAGAALYIYNEREGHEVFIPHILPDRLSEGNLDPRGVDLENPGHNADTLNMIANNIREGRDPVARLEQLINLAVAMQRNGVAP